MVAVAKGIETMKNSSSRFKKSSGRSILAKLRNSA